MIITLLIIAFTNEDGRNQLKTYYLSRNVQLSWANAYSFCRANDMNLVELPTKKEADKFLTLCANYAPAFWYHVGGSAEGMSDRLDYYWMTTGEQITYSIEYLHEQPDNSNGKEKCLSIAMSPNKFQFNDVDCWEHFIWHFVCQQVKDI